MSTTSPDTPKVERFRARALWVMDKLMLVAAVAAVLVSMEKLISLVRWRTILPKCLWACTL